MKILYVENHLVFARQAVSRFLSAHEVTIVPSLSKAIRHLAERFDLVMVDYDLDDGKGAELIVQIQKHFPTLHTIGVSSHEEGNQAMMQAGASAFCSKMDFDHIEAIIDRFRPARGLPNA